MSKRSLFTTLTPLPEGISRETVMQTLRSHTEMIDLNPLIIERHPIKAPPYATAEEYHCIWYSLTDRVQYLPGGLASGKVSYTCCFHDLENGLQTHCYAPLGLDIKGKWTLGGSLPGEPIAPVEIGLGAPLRGLWLREDVDMRCNIMMSTFVKKTLKRAHSQLVDRLAAKCRVQEAPAQNPAWTGRDHNSLRGSQASTNCAHGDYDAQRMAEGSMTPNRTHSNQQSLAAFPPPHGNGNSHSRDSYGPGHGHGHMDLRTSQDERPYPAALHIGELSGLEKGLVPDPAAGGQHPSERVSWHGPALTQPPPDYQPYRPPPSQGYHGEIQDVAGQRQMVQNYAVELP